MRTVRIWTVQAAAALEAARRRGFLRGDLRRGTPRQHPNYRRAYRWIMARMAERLPACSGDPPVWAWPALPENLAEWGGPRPIPLVLVEAEVPADRTLATDHDKWNGVLSGDFIVRSEREWRRRRDASPAEAEASWERVFELVRRTPWERRWWGETADVQLCVDRVLLEEIVSVRAIPRGRDA